ncbi:MAG: hypothetical protein ACLGI2_00250, partial [Acidimicrobiia bacterium]
MNRLEKVSRPLVFVIAVLGLSLTGCGGGEDGVAGDTTSSTSATTTTSVVTPTTTPRAGENVVVRVDGQVVPLQRVCRGVDGAVVAIATTGRRIILVREEGLALRIGTEGGTFAETSDVRMTPAGQGT